MLRHRKMTPLAGRWSFANLEHVIAIDAAVRQID
jgi:hypothetical protein